MDLFDVEFKNVQNIEMLIKERLRFGEWSPYDRSSSVYSSHEDLASNLCYLVINNVINSIINTLPIIFAYF